MVGRLLLCPCARFPDCADNPRSPTPGPNKKPSVSSASLSALPSSESGWWRRRDLRSSPTPWRCRCGWPVAKLLLVRWCRGVLIFWVDWFRWVFNAFYWVYWWGRVRWVWLRVIYWFCGGLPSRLIRRCLHWSSVWHRKFPWPWVWRQADCLDHAFILLYY